MGRTGGRQNLAPPLPWGERNAVLYVRRGPANKQRGMVDDAVLQQELAKVRPLL